MGKVYAAVFSVLLLLCALQSSAQTHLGLSIDVVAPLPPMSRGYGLGYGASFMYRKFEMTRSFIFDVSAGLQRISIKDNPDYLIDGQPSSDSYEHKTLTYFPLKVGLAWSFLPNGSPLTQPYAGVDFGYNYAGTLSGGGAILSAARLGWIIYAQEKVLIGFETRYNVQMALNDRFNQEYTRFAANRLDHQFSFNISVLVKMGRRRGKQ